MAELIVMTQQIVMTVGLIYIWFKMNTIFKQHAEVVKRLEEKIIDLGYDLSLYQEDEDDDDEEESNPMRPCGVAPAVKCDTCIKTELFCNLIIDKIKKCEPDDHVFAVKLNNMIQVLIEQEDVAEEICPNTLTRLEYGAAMAHIHTPVE